MARQTCLFAVLATMGTLVGCNQPTPGTSRVLGNVDYNVAFAAARETMSMYFTIDSADPVTGVIVSRPRPAEGRGERLLGGSPARQIATLNINRTDGGLVAKASVAVERQAGSVMGPRGDTYSSVPNQTPAEGEAATTAEQNQGWQREGYARDVERRILNDLFNALHPQPATPLTQPGAGAG